MIHVSILVTKTRIKNIIIIIIITQKRARDDKNAGGTPGKTSQPNLTRGRHVNCEIRYRMKQKEHKIGYKYILLFWHPHTSPGIEAKTAEITKNHL